MSDELRAVAERMVKLATRQLRDYENEEHDDPEMLEILTGHLAVGKAYLESHPANDPQGRSIWEIELDRCRDVMQRVHHLGKVKHIGLREVATALEQLFPPDDGEPITEVMLPGLGFGGHWGDKWRLQTEVIDIVWEDGELCLASRTDKWQVVESGTTLGDLRRLLAALKVGRGDGDRAD